MKAITGGAGFIGTNLAECFLKKGEKVVILDNFSRKGTKENKKYLEKNYSTNLKIFKGDVRKDSKLMEKVFSEAEAVYHLAGQTAVTTSVKDPRKDFETNALGTLNVLEAVRKSKTNPALIFSSTNKVYGDLNQIKVIEKEKRFEYENLNGINEETPIDFHSPYGCSKGSADQYTRDYSRIYALNSVVFRQSCLSENTKILTPDGKYKIKEIKGKKVTVNCFSEENKLTAKETKGSFKTKSHGKKLFEVKTDRGYTIEATNDHKFFTPLGYQKLENIAYGSLVAVHPFSSFINVKPHEKLAKTIIISEKEIKKKMLKYNRKKEYTEKVTEELKNNGLLPLSYNNKKIYLITKLTGYLTGDAYLFIHKKKKENKTVIGMQVYALKEEIEELRKAFRELGFKSGKVIRSTSKSILLSGHTIEGTSHRFSVYSTACFALFDCLGVPIGNKSSTKFLVPEWILNGPKQLQEEYLRGLFGAEMNAPCIYHRKGKEKTEILAASFSQSKNIELKSNALKFRRQVCNLLKKRGIKTYSYELPFKYKKGGDKSVCFQFRVHSSKENLLKFVRIGFAFNRKRNEKLYSIAEFLKKGLPIYFYEKWLKENKKGLEKTELFWDRITEKKEIKMKRIYDLTVPEHHNFIANGFLVHNCIYGKRQFGIESQGWIAWFIIATILGKKLTVYGNGKQVRDVLFADDLNKAFDLATQKIKQTKGKIFNIGGGKNNTLSVLELISLLEKLTGKKINYSFDNARPGDQKVFVSDVSKAKKIFCWQPEINPKKGVKNVFEWVKENQKEIKSLKLF